MVQFVTNQPLRSKVPQVVVENPLKPGRYQFSLVVVDEAKNESQPAQITVTVVEQARPVLQPAVLRAATTVARTTPATNLRITRPK